jgi:hypothetical protein
MTGYHHNADSGNHPAIAAGPDTPGTPPRFRSSPPIQSGFEGILPRPPHATYWGYLSQADIPPKEFKILTRS